MSEQQMPAKIWATYDGGEWSTARLSNDRLFIRSDIAERMAEALEIIKSIENKEYGGDWDEIEEARAVANAALSAFRSATQDTGGANR